MTERIVAVVPVGHLERAKSRLGEVLDAEERRDLVIGLLERTRRHPRDARDRRNDRGHAGRRGGIARGRGRGTRHPPGGSRPQPRARRRGPRRSTTAPRPCSCCRRPPAVSPAAVSDLLGVLDAARPPLVAIVPDRHGRGTNSLLLAPPDVIDFFVSAATAASRIGTPPRPPRPRWSSWTDPVARHRHAGGPAPAGRRAGRTR